VEAQIVNTDGSSLDPDTDVGPVNLWMHSLFSDVNVSLSEKLVSPPSSMYPYRAYIETLLSYGPAAKESQLTGVMWYKDTPGQQDKRTTDNKGFTTRKKLTALSKSVQMMGKLHLDLFCQDKYIHVAGGYRVHFYFYSSDGVFTAGLFQCFHVTYSNGGTQLYLSHIQSHFLDLDFIIGRVCYESKSVPTSSQFNFQIHVVE
jgi:hypothetical protein